MYLKRTAHNMYVSWLRKRKPTQALGDLEVCDTLWERWTSGDDDQALLLAALKSCFEQLSPRAQQALRLRFQEATSRNDIGAALGITEHGAKNLMQRAKQQLRQCVETKIQSKPPESNQPATG